MAHMIRTNWYYICRSPCAYCCTDTCFCGISYNCKFSYSNDCGGSPYDALHPEIVYPASIIPGVALIVGIIVLVVLLRRRKQRRAKKNQELTNYTSIESLQGSQKKYSTKIRSTLDLISFLVLTRVQI